MLKQWNNLQSNENHWQHEVQFHCGCLWLFVRRRKRTLFINQSLKLVRKKFSVLLGGFCTFLLLPVVPFLAKIRIRRGLRVWEWFAISLRRRLTKQALVAKTNECDKRIKLFYVLFLGWEHPKSFHLTFIAQLTMQNGWVLYSSPFWANLTVSILYA